MESKLSGGEEIINIEDSEILSLKNSNYVAQFNLPDSNVPKIGNELLVGQNMRYSNLGDAAKARENIFERIKTVHEDNTGSFI